MPIKNNYKNYFSDKYFVLSFASSLAFLGASLLVNYFAWVYATAKQSNPVTDIFLSNVPVYDVSDIFVYGFLLFLTLVVLLLLFQPQKIPFVLKSSAVFILVRSLFITLTHIGLYPDIFSADVEIFTGITSGGDLFFSGHTGFPFLMALIFWKNKRLRYMFIFFSIFFGTVSLLGHYHYSIDVLAAFFITFGAYHMCLKLFKKDYKISQQ